MFEEQQATEGKINNYLQWPQLQCTKPDTMRAFLNSFFKKEFLSHSRGGQEEEQGAWPRLITSFSS